MTAGYYDDNWAIDDWYVEEPLPAAGPAVPLDLIVLGAAVGVVCLLVVGFLRLMPAQPSSTTAIPPAATLPQDQAAQESQPAAPAVPVAPPAALSGPEAFVMPYDEYILTQGPHGQSYGHYAIDIFAGNGSTINSPIHGRVTQLFTDGIGNPTLVIENEAYIVTMLHGRYDVQVGQEVALGDPLGTESNLGNTRDMNGRSCRGRDCGYHTHLNVYDKQARSNVNPLDLLTQ